jgi:hypothetical protein
MKSLDDFIIKINTRKTDTISFKFSGEIYTKHFAIDGKGYPDKKDLIRNYHLRIGIRKSLWNSYYIETMFLSRGSG